MAGTSRYDRYPSDYLSDTRKLSLEAKGLYNDLLDFTYQQGEAPEYEQGATSERELARFVGAHVRTLRHVLAELIRHGKIRLEGGRLVNGRAVRQLQKINAQRVAGEAPKPSRRASTASKNRRETIEKRSRDGRGTVESTATMPQKQEVRAIPLLPSTSVKPLSPQERERLYTPAPPASACAADAATAGGRLASDQAEPELSAEERAEVGERMAALVRRLTDRQREPLGEPPAKPLPRVLPLRDGAKDGLLPILLPQRETAA